MLATAIEITLVNRINRYDALAAAEEILPILERFLQANRRPTGIGAVKGAPTLKEEVDIDATLAGALSALDRATLALTLGSDRDDHWERIERLREAGHGFETALIQLDGATAPVKQGAPWAMWDDEASNCLSSVRQQLDLLGG